MGKLEKFYIIFTLLYIVIYSFFFFQPMTGPESFERIIPFHLFGMALSLGFIIILIRDVVKRTFKNPNSKVLWSILLIMFWPAVFIYLPKYGFRPRDEIQEPGNNLKYIIGFVVIVVTFFGYMGFMMYSAFQSFEQQTDTLTSLAASGNDDKIIMLLNNAHATETDINGSGNWSPLQSAASNNHPATVKLLVERGANINQQSECNGNTPLHSAASLGYYEVVKVLLDAGAADNIPNFDDKLPLDLAAENGYSQTAQLLETYRQQ